MPPKKDAPKKKRIKYSRWLLTVDPRKKTGSYPGGEAGLRANLEKCARLLHPPFLEKFVYLTPKGHTYAVNVLESSAEHAIEKGQKRGFWHMHALVTLRHDSNCASPTPTSAPRVPRSWEAPSTLMPSSHAAVNRSRISDSTFTRGSRRNRRRRRCDPLRLTLTPHTAPAQIHLLAL